MVEGSFLLEIISVLVVSEYMRVLQNAHREMQVKVCFVFTEIYAGFFFHNMQFLKDSFECS